MQKNRKNNKRKIEKLRMILDNPYDKNLHIEEKGLNSLHKRLVKPTRKDFSYLFRDIESKEGSLDAKVTIHKRKVKEDFSIPEFKTVESGEHKTFEEIRDLFKDEDLYEVEKNEFLIPEFVELKPSKTEEKKLKNLQVEKADPGEVPP